MAHAFWPPASPSAYARPARPLLTSPSAELIERRARELANGAEDTGRLIPKDLS